MTIQYADLFTVSSQALQTLVIYVKLEHPQQPSHQEQRMAEERSLRMNRLGLQSDLIELQRLNARIRGTA